MNYLYFFPLIAGLIITVRHHKLSSFMPLLIAGFGLLLFSSLFNMTWLYYIMHSSNHNHYPTPYWLLSALMSLIYVGGWTMLAAGLGLVLKDVSEKLAFWEEASQNGWRFGAKGVHQQENQTEGLEGTEGLEDLLQEEIHRSAFIAPAAQSYNVQPHSTARAAQPEVIVPLGSSNI